MIDRARRRAWRAYADARRAISRGGSAAPATALIDASRRDPEEWQRATMTRHDAYRRECEPARGTVAVVCVTRRPQLLDVVLADIAGQLDVTPELVVVTNDAGYDEVDVAHHARHVAGPVRVVRRPADTSLGACLNDALEATDARFVAKFDDDDRYGPNYIADALRAHGYAGAGIVGKHSYYAHVAATDEFVLRFPGNEFTYTSTLAGGTLVLDRDRIGHLRFDDTSIGEDRALLAAAHRAGASTFAADRFNYTQVRLRDHAWTVDRETFLRDSVVLGVGVDPTEVNR